MAAPPPIEPVRHVSDAERRARLALRHALTPDSPVASPEAAARAMTVLHATEPATPYLSCWARIPAFERSDLDRSLFTDRTLVKQLAMRRTVFLFPRDLLAAAWPSASARVAATERTRMAQDAVKAGLGDDGHEWLDRTRAEVLAALEREPGGLTAAEIRRAVPALEVKVAEAAGAAWTGTRVLVHLGASAEIVRGASTSHWRVSRPRWTLTRHWLDDVPEALDAASGYRELVRRWLRSFGPGTEDDLVWWLGATKGIVRTALADLGAAPVSLDGGGFGWLLPDDLDEVPDPGPWVALLPVLDPTTMGWKERDFYLGGNRGLLFDRSGNAGSTAWVDGRVVGCWVQDESGAVGVRLTERTPARARRMLDREARRLTAWLDGERVTTGIPSLAMKGVTPPA